MDAQLQNKLRQVQALLDRAEHPNTPPAEAETARAMAEKLMAKYRIEEEELRKSKLASGVDDVLKPIIDEFDVCDFSSEYQEHYSALFRECCWHVDNIRLASRYHCADRGEDPTVAGRGTNAKTYRKSFADGYVGTISNRLWKMRLAAGQESRGLVLAGRKEAVDEAFYERFPHFRPMGENRQIGEGTRGGPGGDCEKCNKAKSGYCRDHQWLKPSTAMPKYKASSSAGLRAGRNSANTADLGRSTGRIGQ